MIGSDAKLIKNHLPTVAITYNCYFYKCMIPNSPLPASVVRQPFIHINFPVYNLDAGLAKPSHV